MQIYIAGKYEARARLIEWRGRLIALGHKVSSTWLDETPKRDEVDAAYMQAAAIRDIKEVCECDLLILDTLDATQTGGREVEYGVAYLRGCDLWVVGPKRNIFHELADKTFIDWPDAITAIKKLDTSNEFRGI